MVANNIFNRHMSRAQFLRTCGLAAGSLFLSGLGSLGDPRPAFASGTVIKNEELCTVGSDHAVVTWVTPGEKTDTSIYIGTDQNNLTKLTMEQNREYHWAEVRNLRPDTRYWYQVESNSARGPKSSFKTLPNPGGRYLFSYALFSDTHISNGVSEGDPNEIYFGKLTEDSMDLLIQCIRDARNRGIDMAVVTGDLTDSSSQFQYEQLRDEILPNFGNTPYYLCIGNHDKYEKRSKGGGLGVRGFFEYIGRRENPYASVMFQDHQFLLIDSCIKDDDWGTIDLDQMEWIRQTLKKGGDRPSYLFFHHTCNGLDVWFGINNFLSFQNVINDFPGVQAVFNGHMHRNVVTTNWLMTRNRPYVELPATVQFPCGYGIVRVYERGFEYNSYKVSRLDLAEKSRNKVILGLVGGAIYTWYAYNGIGDRSITYSDGNLHRPVHYELAVTLDDRQAMELYEKAQAFDGATLTQAEEAGKTRVILGRYESQEVAQEEQRAKSSSYGIQALVTADGNRDVPDSVKQHR